jgi:AraC family transcriptional regulator of adaptative response/methylated-DNA-[protein]-cysteine methyltransferase
METKQVSTASAEQDPRWQLVASRDAAADGAFVYAVRTTGVYCRPSCPARTAKPENVVFYPACEQAEAAGFRPCKRCHPDGQSLVEANATVVARACRMP